MKLNKKGFTLAELLIVIAIIAILIAIAIPVFTSQLRAARLSTDHANIRSAYAWAQSANLMGKPDTDGDGVYDATKDKDTEVKFGRDGKIANSTVVTNPYKLMVTADSDTECLESAPCQSGYIPDKYTADKDSSKHEQDAEITIKYCECTETGGAKSYTWFVIMKKAAAGAGA